jgi:hypothetical protein
MHQHWTSGYTQSELDAAQERFGLRFPPDLVELFLDRRPLAGYDWRTDDDAIIRALQHPLEGLLFDLEHNDLWWPEWGERPASAAERAEVLTKVIGGAPRLVPLLGHRYIPEQPCASGNPVFSVMQSDTIYYGADLEDYFSREFLFDPLLRPLRADVRRIPFWSDLVDRNPLVSTSTEGGKRPLDRQNGFANPSS